MLRNGFTTGSAATAAAMAALMRYLHGYAPDFVNVPLPPSPYAEQLRIPIERTGSAAGASYAEVRKDGGDDPDVTHGMIIRAEISAHADASLLIDGGQGIGRATLPGLPIAPGAAAINPAPRAQIEYGLRQVWPEPGGLRVIISAPEGLERARSTMNGRLGIVGGISILGTHGIVRPFSHAAFEASIVQAMNVARQCGARRVCLATGRRSLAFLRRMFAALPDHNFIIAGDFAAAALKAARIFEKIEWGCFFGKLVKLAQGLENTHARKGELDLRFLADIFQWTPLARMNTAQEALAEILLKRLKGMDRLMMLARRQAEQFSGSKTTIHLFQTDGRELARA